MKHLVGRSYRSMINNNLFIVTTMLTGEDGSLWYLVADEHGNMSPWHKETFEEFTKTYLYLV